MENRNNDRIYLPIINPKIQADLSNEEPHQVVSLEELPEHVVVLHSNYTNATIYLIGTAHVSDVSSRNVEELIHIVHPDSVFIELCYGRRGLLAPPKEVFLYIFLSFFF